MEAAATFAPAVSFDAVSMQAWSRLLKAGAVSFLLHAVLLVGLPVNPTGGVPQVVSTITARLEPAAEADRKSTRLNSSHGKLSRMPSSA